MLLSLLWKLWPLLVMPPGPPVRTCPCSAAQGSLRSSPATRARLVRASALLANEALLGTFLITGTGLSLLQSVQVFPAQVCLSQPPLASSSSALLGRWHELGAPSRWLGRGLPAWQGDSLEQQRHGLPCTRSCQNQAMQHADIVTACVWCLPCHCAMKDHSLPWAKGMGRTWPCCQCSPSLLSCLPHTANLLSPCLFHRSDLGVRFPGAMRAFGNSTDYLL